MSRPSKPPLLVVQYANPDYYPPTFNATNLLRPYFDITVVCRRSQSELREWPSDVRMLRIGPQRSAAASAAGSIGDKVLELTRFVREVRRALREHRPRVVVLYDPHAIVAAALAGCRAPIVYQRHEVEDAKDLDPRTLGGWVLIAAQPLSRRAALVVFPEQHRADHYRSMVPGLRPPLIVPNFPSLQSFPEPEWSRLLPARASRRMVLYRGAIGPTNGIREAIRAMAHVAPDVTLRVCGDGDPAFMAELRALAGVPGLRDRVELAGYVPFNRLNRETLDASVGLHLYQPVDTNWAFSATAVNKTYEYAACGMPTLAPDRRSYQEFFGKESWVARVDETDPAAIAAAIQRLLADRDEHEKLCRAARAAFEDRFNYEIAFAPMLAKIRELAVSAR